MNQKQGIRLAMLHILHAILWVMVMIIADTIWGDDSIKWTVIGFVISSSLLTTWFTIFARQKS
ncbi:hypothetical protein [Aquisalinus flavus]|uniref:Uncharacterized protein n=1 Tax=Aquisalinus flavus TaxID=1526572 RepID=A0A8J2Y4Q5_9PROT|nr:hypothetical protein [Aquisalinus flavus]MBD0427275.1 hypothetical protein [Aquisalinus flavus]UNE47087.1 hypothetical protein FF099_02940 [Aquisalinus flavus]GGC99706.1 hypothetical protein GCM10011342_05900 [Aquisalinus flavus]